MKRVKELGMKSIVIIDYGVLYGLVDFYKVVKENGIKLILGCEVYVVVKFMKIKQFDKDNVNYYFVLFVKNEVGYENLMKIVLIVFIDGFYYKLRVDYEYFRIYSEGLIVLSVCLGGEV